MDYWGGGGYWGLGVAKARLHPPSSKTFFFFLGGGVVSPTSPPLVPRSYAYEVPHLLEIKLIVTFRRARQLSRHK